MNSEAMLQEAIEANLVRSIWRVSGELGIAQFNMVCHLHDLGKGIYSHQIVPCVTKILQNF